MISAEDLQNAGLFAEEKDASQREGAAQKAGMGQNKKDNGIQDEAVSVKIENTIKENTLKENEIKEDTINENEINKNKTDIRNIDKNKIEQGIRLLLEAIGENPQREGLKETPQRIARMYEEIFAGMQLSAAEPLAKTFQAENTDMVLEQDITFYSMCEHHMLPFYGKAHIAYIPDGKVAGLSKLARTVEVFARRLQLQEQMTAQTADAVMEYLKPKGAMVVLEAEHLCMTMRGIKKPGSRTVTYAARGSFEGDDVLQSRVFQMLRL